MTSHDSPGLNPPLQAGEGDKLKRTIRSFVLRQGRITPAQQRAFEQHWQRFGVDYGGEARDLNVGVEVHRPGVGRLMNALAARETRNVRIWNHDAIEVLENELAPESLDEVRIWFPDPWHKKRHHKRRLIQPAFARLLASRVKLGGLLHLATDWADYAAQMREVLEAAPAWRNRGGDGGYAERPPWRIETRFEQRGVRLGHGVWDLLYDRV